MEKIDAVTVCYTDGRTQVFRGAGSVGVHDTVVGEDRDPVTYVTATVLLDRSLPKETL